MRRPPEYYRYEPYRKRRDPIILGKDEDTDDNILYVFCCMEIGEPFSGLDEIIEELGIAPAELNLVLQSVFYRLNHPREGGKIQRRIDYAYDKVFNKLFSKENIEKFTTSPESFKSFSRHGIKFLDMFFSYPEWLNRFFYHYNNHLLMDPQDQEIKKNFLKFVLVNGALSYAYKNDKGIDKVFENIEKHIHDPSERHEVIESILFKKNRMGSIMQLLVLDNDPKSIAKIFEVIETNYSDPIQRKELFKKILLKDKLITNDVFKSDSFRYEFNSVKEIFKAMDEFIYNDDEKSEFLKEFFNKQNLQWNIVAKSLEDENLKKSAQIIIDQFKKIKDQSYIDGTIVLIQQKSEKVEQMYKLMELLQNNSNPSINLGNPSVKDSSPVVTRG